jgi:hypothetical protein
METSIIERMILLRLKNVWLGLTIIFLLGSAIVLGSEEKIDYSKNGVCIVPASIRAESNQTSKWLSSLSVGETVILESNPSKDPKDPKIEYVKVKLSDGTEGFVNTWCLVRGAYVAVVHRTAKIYKRPDLLADTNSSFEMLNIVAIDDEKGSWIRATGENRIKSGWIERVATRKANEDIVTAVLLNKAMLGKEKTMTHTELEKIVAALPFPNNYFAIKILQKYPATNNPNPTDKPSASNNIDSPEPTPDQTEQ